MSNSEGVKVSAQLGRSWNWCRTANLPWVIAILALGGLIASEYVRLENMRDAKRELISEQSIIRDQRSEIRGLKTRTERLEAQLQKTPTQLAVEELGKKLSDVKKQFEESQVSLRDSQKAIEELKATKVRVSLIRGARSITRTYRVTESGETIDLDKVAVDGDPGFKLNDDDPVKRVVVNIGK